MARFLFLDQSLKGPGGHHFDYALHVIRAAEELGFETCLATHRSFRGHHHFPRECAVANVFRHTVYNRFSEFSPKKGRRAARTNPASESASSADTSRSEKDMGRSEKDMGRSEKNAGRTENNTGRAGNNARSTSGVSPEGSVASHQRKGLSWRAMRERWQSYRHHRGRERVIRHFQQDIASLFESVPHLAGDHIFLATVSDVELLGAAQYASHQPTSRLANWHFQFHFNILQGRPHEYAGQQHAVDRCRERFRGAIDLLKDHRTFLYNTSDELTDQYGRLGLGEFESLTYPINPNLAPSSSAATTGPGVSTAPQPEALSSGEKSEQAATDQESQPLRMTLAGAVRREKGQEELKRIIRELSPRLLESGRAQLVVQRKRRSRFRRQQVDLANSLSTTHHRSLASPAIVYVDHPLSDKHYEQLMKSADLGLFLYDGRTYYARRAGVLGEFLSLGIPVIVPSGCWLSEQLRETQEAYLAKLIAPHAPLLDKIWPESGQTNNEGPTAITRQSPLEFKLELPKQTKSIVLGMELISADGEETFALVENVESNASTRQERSPVESREAVVVSSHSNHATASAMLRSRGEQLHLRIRPAFEIEQLAIRRLRLFANAQENLPLGQVGLVAANLDQVPRLLEELANHFPHYRQSAASFATDWYAKHDARQVVRRLTRRADEERRRMAA